MDIQLTDAYALQMATWCTQNVSKLDFAYTLLDGIKVGGKGWQIYESPGDDAIAYIEDEALHAFFMLTFNKE